jgi:hypothetical protein
MKKTTTTARHKRENTSTRHHTGGNALTAKLQQPVKNGIPNEVQCDQSPLWFQQEILLRFQQLRMNKLVSGTLSITQNTKHKHSLLSLSRFLFLSAMYDMEYIDIYRSKKIYIGILQDKYIFWYLFKSISFVLFSCLRLEFVLQAFPHVISASVYLISLSFLSAFRRHLGYILNYTKVFPRDLNFTTLLLHVPRK